MAGPDADILDRKNWILEFSDVSKAQPQNQICDTPVPRAAVAVEDPKKRDCKFPQDAFSDRILSGDNGHYEELSLITSQGQ